MTSSMGTVQRKQLWRSTFFLPNVLYKKSGVSNVLLTEKAGKRKEQNLVTELQELKGCIYLGFFEAFIEAVYWVAMNVFHWTTLTTDMTKSLYGGVSCTQIYYQLLIFYELTDLQCSNS